MKKKIFLSETNKFTLMNGNIIDFIHTTKKKIDTVVTSPPYNIKKDYKGYSDSLDDDEFLSLMSHYFLMMRSILKPTSNLFINFSSKASNQIMSYRFAQALQAVGYDLTNTIIWVKSYAKDDITKGHFKPIPGQRYFNNNFEFIFHFTLSNEAKLNKTGIGVPYMDESNIARFDATRKGTLRDRGNVWFFPYKTTTKYSDKPDHPCPYPIELPLACIKATEYKNTTILDPFAGTNVTGLACKELDGCDYIGIDISKKYWKDSCKQFGKILKRKKK